MKLILLFLTLVSVALAQTAPDLSSVPVGNRSKPLTHARVVSVSPNGILFKCDQGAVQVPFSMLPAEVAAYYAPQTSKSATIVSSAPVKSAPTVVKAPTITAKVKTPVDAAKDAKAKADMKVWLLAKIAGCEGVISRYDRQSSFSKDKLITKEEYEVAKTELVEIKAKLAELGE